MSLLNQLNMYTSGLPTRLLSTPEEPGLLKVWSSTLIDIFKFPLTIYRTNASFHHNEELGDLPIAAVLASFGRIMSVPFYLTGEAKQINDYCHAQGYQTSWVFGAKKEDLERVLLDDQVQSLVTVGHGSRSSFQLRDSVITTAEIAEIYGNRTRKNGFWVQYSCGSFEGLPLGFSVMENPRESCLFYQNKVNTFHRQHLGIPQHSLHSLIETEL